MSKHLNIYQILENCRSDPLNSQVHQEKSSRSINRNRKEERHSCVNDQMWKKKSTNGIKIQNSNKDEKHMQETRTSKDQILMITQKKEMDRSRSTGISSLAKQSRNQEIRKKPWSLGEALYMEKKKIRKKGLDF